MRSAVVAALAVALWGCGDDSGYVQPKEDCAHPGDEDGNGLADCDDPACRLAPECTTNMVCGDGLTTGNELCDDGNKVNGDGCDNNCTPSGCGNGIQAGDETCDDDNTVSGDGCSNTCQRETELEPDDTIADADTNDTWPVTSDVLIRASIAAKNDQDLFAFTNPTSAPVVIDFDVWNPTTGPGVQCGASPDTKLVVFGADQVVIAQNLSRNGTSDMCSSARGFTLAPGDKLYAQIDSRNGTDTFDYELGVTVHPEQCGDGYVTPDEECDDGNTTAGDGCDATCRAEGLLAEVEPDDSISDATHLVLPEIARGSVTGSDRDLYSFVLAAPATVEIATFTGLWTCDAQVNLQLLDEGGAAYSLDTSIVDTHTEVGCGQLTVALPSGTYYAAITGNAGAYFVAVAEIFDAGAETEAPDATGDNDTSATAETGLDGDAVMTGNLPMASDRDFYAIEVPAGAGIRANVFEGPADLMGACDDGTLHPHLWLYDSDGTTLLAQDFGDGRGACAFISGVGDDPIHPWARNPSGATVTWYLAVGTDALATLDYRLSVTAW